jgi:sulfofructose kinase
MADSTSPQSTEVKVDVVGMGLNATDTLMHVPSYPASGSKTEMSSLTLLPGGQVATAVIACQRWGLRTRYIGKLGDDPGGALHRREFVDSGVETQIVAVPGTLSHQSYILVDSDGERTVICHHDPKLTIRPAELKREWITMARALLVDGFDTEAAITAATWAREAGIPVIADLDEIYIGIENLLAKIDYLIVSRDFPLRVCGEPDLRRSLPLLQRRFGCRLSAATLGTSGVLAWDGGQFLHACAYRVAAIDTTGAGDIFHAGFIYGLLQAWPLPRNLDFACAAAALNCTAHGARGGIRPVRDIDDLRGGGKRYASVEFPK